VWFFLKNWNTISVPGSAMILLGVKVMPSFPTATLKGDDVAVTAAGAGARALTAVKPTATKPRKVFVNCMIMIYLRVYKRN